METGLRLPKTAYGMKRLKAYNKMKSDCLDSRLRGNDKEESVNDKEESGNDRKRRIHFVRAF